MPTVERAVVVGAGVAGLTTAVCLAEAGYETQIVAASPPLDTTSVVAAAIWHPFPAAAQWMRPSFERFSELATDPHSGVYELDVVEYLNEPESRPPWAGELRSFRELEPADVPPPYTAGRVLGTVRVEPPLYLPYLASRLASSGGTVDQREVRSLADLAGPATVVVNCSGLGARRLAGDDSMYPVKGQVVHVTNPGITHGVHIEVAGMPLTYILPRNDVVVLGGVRLHGDGSVTPDPEITRRILRDTRLLEPRLADADVVGVAVGLRPGRPRPRVEVESTAAGPVVHNYGHDGNGYGMSWGCAEEIVRLVQTIGVAG